MKALITITNFTFCYHNLGTNKFSWKKEDFCNKFYFYDKYEFFRDEVCINEKILYLTISYFMTNNFSEDFDILNYTILQVKFNLS